MDINETDKDLAINKYNFKKMHRYASLNHTLNRETSNDSKIQKV